MQLLPLLACPSCCAHLRGNQSQGVPANGTDDARDGPQLPGAVPVQRDRPCSHPRPHNRACHERSPRTQDENSSAPILDYLDRSMPIARRGLSRWVRTVCGNAEGELRGITRTAPRVEPTPRLGVQSKHTGGGCGDQRGHQQRPQVCLPRVGEERSAVQHRCAVEAHRAQHQPSGTVGHPSPQLHAGAHSERGVSGRGSVAARNETVRVRGGSRSEVYRCQESRSQTRRLSKQSRRFSRGPMNASSALWSSTPSLQRSFSLAKPKTVGAG